MRNLATFSSVPKAPVVFGVVQSISSNKKKKRKKEEEERTLSYVNEQGGAALITPEKSAQLKRVVEDLTDDDLRLFFEAFKGMSPVDIQAFFNAQEPERNYYRVGKYNIYTAPTADGLEHQLWEDSIPAQCLVTGPTSLVLQYVLKYCKAALATVMAVARTEYIRPTKEQMRFMEDPEAVLEDWRAFRRTSPALDQWTKKAQFETVDEDHPYYRFYCDDSEDIDTVTLVNHSPLTSASVGIACRELETKLLGDTENLGDLVVADLMDQPAHALPGLADTYVALPDSKVSLPVSVVVNRDIDSFVKLRPHNLEVTVTSGNVQSFSSVRYALMSSICTANVERNENFVRQHRPATRKKLSVKSWQLTALLKWNPKVVVPDEIPIWKPPDRYDGKKARWMPPRPRANFVKLAKSRHHPKSLNSGNFARLPKASVRLGPASCQDPHIGTSIDSFRSFVLAVDHYGYRLDWRSANREWYVEDRDPP